MVWYVWCVCVWYVWVCDVCGQGAPLSLLILPSPYSQCWVWFNETVCSDNDNRPQAVRSFDPSHGQHSAVLPVQCGGQRRLSGDDRWATSAEVGVMPDTKPKGSISHLVRSSHRSSLLSCSLPVLSGRLLWGSLFHGLLNKRLNIQIESTQPVLV